MALARLRTSTESIPRSMIALGSGRPPTDSTTTFQVADMSSLPFDDASFDGL
jgi:ubiquinone/menaquinone biosynthesis C-methylase UbiE